MCPLLFTPREIFASVAVSENSDPGSRVVNPFPCLEPRTVMVSLLF